MSPHESDGLIEVEEPNINQIKAYIPQIAVQLIGGTTILLIVPLDKPSFSILGAVVASFHPPPDED